MSLYMRRSLIAFLCVVGIGSSVTSAFSAALELDADLVASPAGCFRGEADFNQTATRKREFSVEVAGLRPGAEVPVRVAGVVVGSAEINTCGTGELSFADDNDPEEATFPANFPTLTGGEGVRVGPLRGRLRPENDQQDTVLDADLFAPFPSCFSGKAELEDTEGEREFSVEVSGMKPGRRVNVSVARVVVGSIQIDDCGVGELAFADAPDPTEGEVPFPPNFPTLTGGEGVRVGPLWGKLGSDD